MLGLFYYQYLIFNFPEDSKYLGVPILSVLAAVFLKPISEVLKNTDSFSLALAWRQEDQILRGALLYCSGAHA
jgi:hypothetical protein